MVGLELGARAGVHTPVSACASGAEAIAYAVDMIRTGRADVVVAGGTEAAIHPLPLAGFAAMQALSTRNDEPERASRPYDKGRDGFVLGEGAGVARARDRSSTPQARGATDLRRDRRRRHHLRRPPHRAARPGRAGAARAMRHGARGGRRHARPTSCTSTRTPPRRRSATSPRPRRSAPRSATPSTASRLGDQVDDRPPARRGRRGRDASPPSSPCATGWPRRPSTSRTSTTTSTSTSSAASRARCPTASSLALNNSFGFGGHNVALAVRSVQQ